MRVFYLFITYTVLHVSSTVFYTYIGGLVILMSLFVAVHAQSVCVPFSLFCVIGKKIIHVVDATLATMYLHYILPIYSYNTGRTSISGWKIYRFQRENLAAAVARRKTKSGIVGRERRR